jgi:hypothetical protein
MLRGPILAVCRQRRTGRAIRTRNPGRVTSCAAVNPFARACGLQSQTFLQPVRVVRSTPSVAPQSRDCPWQLDHVFELTYVAGSASSTGPIA